MAAKKDRERTAIISNVFLVCDLVRARRLVIARCCGVYGNSLIHNAELVYVSILWLRERKTAGKAEYARIRDKEVLCRFLSKYRRSWNGDK